MSVSKRTFPSNAPWLILASDKYGNVYEADLKTFCRQSHIMKLKLDCLYEEKVFRLAYSIYFGAGDRKFRALNLETGKLMWFFNELRCWVQSKAVVYEGKVYFGCWNIYFYSLDQKTGKLLWKWVRFSNESYPSSIYAPAACWPVAAIIKYLLPGNLNSRRAINL